MNRSDFLKLMDGSTGTFDRRMIGEIAEIVSMFPYFHSAHLLLLKGLNDSSDVKFGNQLRNSALHVASREVLYNLLNRTITLPSDDTAATLSPADLIDKFIIANPKIGPIREKSEGLTEDRSEEPHGDGSYVTETLARIYINQGYYSRAIDIFEKLSLKYPEKSSYFATQIQKVKELLKK